MAGCAAARVALALALITGFISLAATGCLFYWFRDGIVLASDFYRRRGMNYFFHFITASLLSR